MAGLGIWSRGFILVLILLILSAPAVPLTAAGFGKIYTAPAINIAEYIGRQPGRKVIFIYTSWCPYCRDNMPVMIDIEEEKPGSVFAISADQSMHKLGVYLSSFPALPFRVLRMKDHTSSDIEMFFKVPGRRGIPYKILIDENNKVVEYGNMPVDRIADFILKGK